MNASIKNNLKQQLEWFNKNSAGALASGLTYSVVPKPQIPVKYEFVNNTQRGSADLKVSRKIQSNNNY
jgi:hypothetical protein